MCRYAQIVLVVAMVAGLWGVASCLELVETSSDVLLEQSTALSLTCRADQSWSMCSWLWQPHAGPSSTCDVASSAKGAETVCPNSRAAVTATQDSCSIRIDVMELDDAGQLTCRLVHLGEETQLQMDTANINVEIAVPAQVTFVGDIFDVETEKWVVEEGQEYSVECSGLAGYPAPDITAYLGPSQQINDQDMSLPSEEVEPTQNTQDDRLLDVAKVFMFTPERSDCGKFVKCEGKQLNEDGELLFGNSVIRTKQIMVVFPPRDLGTGDQWDFSYSEESGSGQMEVAIQFESHPAPTNQQVEWHFGETVLNAGQSIQQSVEEDQEENQDMDIEPTIKYEAMEIENDEEGDTVTVRLIIHNVEQQDSQLESFVNITNGVGEDKILRIPFNILFEAAPIIETTTIEISTEGQEEYTEEHTEAPPEVGEDNEGQQMDSHNEPPVKSSGAGGGTVAAIVLILVALLITAAAVLWLKKNERLCFKPYQEVNQKPDPEAQTHKNIIKDQQSKDENGQQNEKL